MFNIEMFEMRDCTPNKQQNENDKMKKCRGEFSFSKTLDKWTLDKPGLDWNMSLSLWISEKDIFFP